MYPAYTETPTYIDNNTDLARWCQQWANETVLALDTEFIRTDTFYPIGALIQVSDDKHCFLIDPLTIDDFKPFIELLNNPRIVKVLHSCSEDLEVFDRLFATLPEPIFDTQIAAAMDGLGFSLSYQRLTELLLDLHVPKGETRSNWLQRPLTGSQIHYAALDVAYLPEIYRRLSDSLAEKGRASWIAEDCRALHQSYRQNSQAEQYIYRVKSAWRLSPPELAQLRDLVLWREKMARSKDRPRGRILKDASCVDIVRQQPQRVSELGAINDVGPKTVRRYGETILDILDAADHTEALPDAIPGPLPPSSKGPLNRLKKFTQQRAEQLQLAAEVLARKKDFEALVRSGMDGGEYRLPESLCGWRQAVIGDELLALAKQG